MTIAAAIVGVLLLATVLWDAFETVVLPRRVSRQLRAHAALLPRELAALRGLRRPVQDPSTAARPT